MPAQVRRAHVLGGRAGPRLGRACDRVDTRTLPAAVMWFRRDLRIEDHHALAAAIAAAGRRRGDGPAVRDRPGVVGAVRRQPALVPPRCAGGARRGARRPGQPADRAVTATRSRSCRRWPPRSVRRRCSTARTSGSTGDSVTNGLRRRWPTTVARWSKPTARGWSRPAPCGPRPVTGSRCTRPTCGCGANSGWPVGSTRPSGCRRPASSPASRCPTRWPSTPSSPSRRRRPPGPASSPSWPTPPPTTTTVATDRTSTAPPDSRRTCGSGWCIPVSSSAASTPATPTTIGS